jgi:N-acetylmuramoyl-L-alanine amidase
MLPPLPPAEIVCIAQIIHAEARGESDLGQRAVGHVVMNRSRKQGIKPCIIIRQPGQFQVKLKKHYSGKSWLKAYQIATYLGKDPTGGAQYFRHIRCHGKWGHKITTSIGAHNFYK